MTSPLEGIKVIDMTEVQSGPSCTQMLAWFGAEVIKIERPGGGDPTRNELTDLPGMDGLYYLQLNSNKRSMGLNVKTPEGKEILTKLLREADVFVENLHPRRRRRTRLFLGRSTQNQPPYCLRFHHRL